MRKINIKSFLLILIVFILIVSGCRNKDEDRAQNQQSQITTTLQVWNVFDESSIFDPLFAEFKSKHVGLQIEYRKFENPAEYLDLIINEMAEGEGPDIFFIHNSWVQEHFKKILSADVAYIPADAFRETFVASANDDCILKGADGIDRVYCMPMYVDDLAMYYNKEHFEEVLPEEGKPARTWAEVENQVYKLTKEDNSFERFARSGIAMGRADNISRAYDILQMLMLQADTKFYNETDTSAVFASQQGVSSSGQAYYPARTAFEIYTNFAIPNNKQYSWNRYIANPVSEEKEIIPFVTGKVSMIAGYSYLYNELLNQIDMQGKKGLKTINANDIEVALMPQVFDPLKGETQVTLASFFAPTVSRTSKNAELAWQLISFLTTKENQQYYNEKTHRPSSRRDLVETQSAYPVYGIFSKQLGFAKSLKIFDSEGYEEIFLKAVTAITENGVKVAEALKEAEASINEVLKN